MPSFVVAVYHVELAYGGPEEGDWWYQAGSLVRPIAIFRNQERAYAFCRRLNTKLDSRRFGPNEGKPQLSSVLSDGEYCAEVHEDSCPAGYPDRKPHYE